MLYASAFLIDPCLLLSFSVSILRIHFIGVLITVQLPGGRMLSTGTASASTHRTC